MDNSILASVGFRVREIRKERKLSQEQLGEIAGFHFSYIGGIERGEKNVSLLNLQKIAEALSVPVYELLKYEVNTKPPRSEKEHLLVKVQQLTVKMNSKDLKKMLLFITEIMDNK
ncbi:helix-turn-helix domain-containing protein [Paenibacillus sp. 481]|uniref:helix-turn-helix domain-containing protein n=1 Tax=Paenibacillus sp. 481 TaxID=2835869 RepID=UPI001E565179|nr:helix-turn-helix transcriptional regulator [Paenibacillus sp. 481]UHA73271.1 helix-turn-helix transcriptional regulator [Paenibacillus sp. 481]